jgi:hypothetical protein
VREDVQEHPQLWDTLWVPADLQAASVALARQCLPPCLVIPESDHEASSGIPKNPHDQLGAPGTPRVLVTRDDKVTARCGESRRTHGISHKKGSSGGRPVSHDPDLYRDRNTVEHAMNKIEDWRGLATRYDKTPTSYEAGLHLRGSVIWLRSLTPAP